LECNRMLTLSGANCTESSSLDNLQYIMLSASGAIIRSDYLSIVSVNYSIPVMIIVAILLSMLAIVTAFGNLLVGLALFRYRQLRTISNCLIGNLALSDFLLATTVLPLSIANECLGHWIFGPLLCRMWLVMDVLYCTASIWNLCLIAVDRFTATLYPVWYRDRSSARRRIFVYVSLIWTISAAICVPPLLGWNDLDNSYVVETDSNENSLYKCVLFQTPSYVLYSAAGSFFVPFVVTFVLYVGIFCAMRRLGSRRRNRQKKPKNSRQTVQQTQSSSSPSNGSLMHFNSQNEAATGVAMISLLLALELM
jgi:7 transmembrane receptor (rhodopsin family)